MTFQRVFRLVAAGLVALDMCNRVWGDDLTFSGTMKSQVVLDYMPKEKFDKLIANSGPGWARQEWEWKVLISGNRWRIDIRRAEQNANERFQFGSDGSTTYSLDLLREPDPQNGNAGKSKSNDSIAVIENGVMPYEGTLCAHPLW